MRIAAWIEPSRIPVLVPCREPSQLGNVECVLAAAFTDATGGDPMNESIDPQSVVPMSIQPSFVPTLTAPMTFGQILDRTYRLMRKHYRLFLEIAAVPAVCVLASMAAAIGSVFGAYEHLAAQVPKGTTVSFTPTYFLDHFVWIILCFYPIMIAAYALYLPAASFAATQADRGFVVSVRQAYN